MIDLRSPGHYTNIIHVQVVPHYTNTFILESLLNLFHYCKIYSKEHIKFSSKCLSHAGKVLKDPLAVPLYLPLTFKIAIGLEEGTNKDFKDLQKRYAHFLKDVDYTRVDMNEGK